MGDAGLTGTAAAYWLAGRGTTGALVKGLRERTLILLARGYELPRALTEAVAASGDRELTLALADNLSTGCLFGGTGLLLARLGDPEVGAVLYVPERGNVGTFPVRREVLAHADPAEPGWRAPGGLVERIQATTDPDALDPAVHARFPELVAWALRHRGDRVPAAMAVAACRRVYEDGGREALRTLAGLLPPWGEIAHPELSGLLTAALDAPDPLGVLAAEPTFTHELAFRMRRSTGWWGPWDVELDGDALLAEHARLPFHADAIMTFTRFPGCPRDLAMEALRADPAGTAIRGRGPLPVDALLEVLPKLWPEQQLNVLSGALKDGRLTADTVLARVRPARIAVRSVLAAGAGQGPARASVAGVLAPLGADAAAWVALYRLAGRFEGTAPELVAQALARADRSAATWPRPAQPTYPAREPEDPRRIFQQLFLCAPPQVQEALLPVLDGRAVQHLLVFGRPSPRLRARAVAVHGRSALLATASRWDLPAEVVEELLDLDDPEINARLYLYGAIATEERVRILAGRGRGGGEVPVHPGLLEDLLQVKAPHRRHWHTAGHFSGDPDVLRHTLARCRMHTEAGWLRAVVRLWERHGRAEVGEFLDEREFPGSTSAKHPMPAAVRAVVRRAVDDPDGLPELRRRLAAEEDPRRQTARLRRAGAHTVRDQVRYLVEEGGTLPWKELLATHVTEPLPAPLLAALAEAADCPYELLLAALAAREFPPRAEGMDWLPATLDEGRLTTADLLRHARPAAAVFGFLTATDVNRLPHRPRWRPPYREALALVRRHLTDAPAWAAAIDLLPEFPGTLAELIRAAGREGAAPTDPGAAPGGHGNSVGERWRGPGDEAGAVSQR